MSNQSRVSVGDKVRVRHGRHEGEIATVGNITWHSNQFGSYARVHLELESGQVDDRSMDDLEKMDDARLSTQGEVARKQDDQR